MILIISIIVILRMTQAMAASDCIEPVPNLFQRVSPSVVFISATDFDKSKIVNRMRLSAVSGFIISNDGLVLTNSHVVFGQQAITVTLDDDRQTQAKLLGLDPILDLAVLRIPVPPEGHPKTTLGDSEILRISEDVVAIGNPFGFEQTLTRGVVSGINRILPELPMSLMLPLIQTDASINPGNSGGPLLNRWGEVIGINTLILADVQNVGFAIPINIPRRLFQS